MKRLVFVTVFVVLLGALFLPCALAGDSPPRGTGRISLFNYYTGEHAEIAYREGGRINPSALKEIARFMRSRGDDAVHAIDPRLIELLDRIQQHFGAETIEIISGYRSPKFNGSLRDEGRNVAKESLHLQGMAADIHIDEVDEAALFDYVKSLHAGGAGIYPRYFFVHVDVGPVRTWGEAAAPARELIGTQNNPNPAWAAVTDKNVYRPGDEVAVKITNNEYGSQRFATNVWYERFRKGQWAEHESIEKDGKTTKLEQGESAAYAWKLPAGQPLGKYRLVFFASKDLSLPPAYSNEFYVRR
jgi:uncharacterized protein YcbK (DUF882 family)